MRIFVVYGIAKGSYLIAFVRYLSWIIGTTIRRRERLVIIGRNVATLMPYYVRRFGSSDSMESYPQILWNSWETPAVTWEISNYRSQVATLTRSSACCGIKNFIIIFAVVRRTAISSSFLSLRDKKAPQKNSFFSISYPRPA